MAEVPLEVVQEGDVELPAVGVEVGQRVARKLLLYIGSVSTKSVFEF